MAPEPPPRDAAPSSWTDLDKTCPSCGFENHKLALFCKRCRHDLFEANDGGGGAGGVPIAAQPVTHQSVSGEDVARSRRPSSRVAVALVTVLAVVGATLGVLAVLGIGRSRQGADRTPVALALAFRTGRTTSYHVSMGMNATMRAGGRSTPLDFTGSQDFRWSVLSVAPNGTATIRIAASDATVSAGGHTQTVPTPSRTFLLTADGRLISNGTTVFAGVPNASLLSSGEEVTAILPDRPVRPGQTWSKTVSFNAFGSPIRYTVTGTYLRTERVDGIEAAVVRSTSAFPMNLAVPLGSLQNAFGLEGEVPPQAVLQEVGKVSATTTSWIDTGTKALLKTTALSDLSVQLTVSGVKGAKGIPAITIDGSLTMTLDRA